MYALNAQQLKSEHQIVNKRNKHRRGCELKIFIKFCTNVILFTSLKLSEIDNTIMDNRLRLRPAVPVEGLNSEDEDDVVQAPLDDLEIDMGGRTVFI